MSKKSKASSQKSSSHKKQASPEQIYFVIKNNILVYPISEFTFLSRKGKENFGVIKYQRWYIEVNNNGKIQVFDKKVDKDDLNESIALTIIYFYNKLKEKQNGK